jgi:SAM-dependent methyltransferase
MIAAARYARGLAVAASCMALSLAAVAQTGPGTYEPQVGQAGKDVVWVPTPDEVVAKMLDQVQLQPGERMVDLGSGDGKITIAAGKRGAIARGIEYNPDMVTLSRRNAEKAGVKVELVQGDIFVSDFTNVDVVTLYLLPHLNERLKPTLLAMKPGTRVTSHAFRMGDWEPDETATVSGREAHFWRVPANIEGTWSFTSGNNPGPTIKIRQQHQKIEGGSEWGTRAAPLSEATVKGSQVKFIFTDDAGALHRFEGHADHKGPIVGVSTPYSGGAPKLMVGTRR